MSSTRARDVRRVYRGVDFKGSKMGYLVTQGRRWRPVAFVPYYMQHAREVAEEIASRKRRIGGWVGDRRVWDLRRNIFRSFSGLFRMVFHRLDQRGRRLRGGGFDCLTYERGSIVPGAINVVVSGEDRWARERLQMLAQMEQERMARLSADAERVAAARSQLKGKKKSGSPHVLAIKPDGTRRDAQKCVAAA